jgi:hypothetical protein
MKPAGVHRGLSSAAAVHARQGRSLTGIFRHVLVVAWGPQRLERVQELVQNAIPSRLL